MRSTPAALSANQQDTNSIPCHCMPSAITGMQAVPDTHSLLAHATCTLDATRLRACWQPQQLLCPSGQLPAMLGTCRLPAHVTSSP